jgi:MFS family permease
MANGKILRRIRNHPLILPVYLPSFMSAICHGLLIPVLPLFILSFDVSYGLVGLFLASTGIGMLISDVPAALILRRLGERNSMLLGLAFTTLSTFALFWSQTIPQALVLRLTAGFGMALFGISRHIYITDVIALSSRGRANALFGGLMRIGKFVGPAIGGLVAAAFGLRAVFLLFAAVYVFIFVLVAIFIAHRDLPAFKSSTHQGNPLYITITTQYRILLTAGLGQIFGQLVRSGVVVIVPLYAAEVLGLKVEAIGLIISLAAVVDLAFFYPAGLIMDGHGRKYAIIPCFFIQAIGLALLPFSYNFSSLLMISALISLGNGLGSGTMLTLGSDLAPEGSRAEFLSLWRFIGDLGHTGGPLVVGVVAALATLQVATWAVSVAGLLAVLVFAHHVPETLKKP